MNNKIIIPKTADCFCSNHGELNYHVSIKNKDDFENFCSDNNIGYHDGARKDIVKSSRHIFTLNKDVFENFQNDAETIN